MASWISHFFNRKQGNYWREGMAKKYFESLKRKMKAIFSRGKNKPKDKNENQKKEKSHDIYPLWWSESGKWIDLFHGL